VELSAEVPGNAGVSDGSFSRGGVVVVLYPEVPDVRE
jgi:hypothetical protein